MIGGAISLNVNHSCLLMLLGTNRVSVQVGMTTYVCCAPPRLADWSVQHCDSPGLSLCVKGWFSSRLEHYYEYINQLGWENGNLIIIITMTMIYVEPYADNYCSLLGVKWTGITSWGHLSTL